MSKGRVFAVVLLGCVTLTGRIKSNAGEGEKTLRIVGDAGDRELQINIRPENETDAAAAKALPAVWARRQIADLYDRSTFQDTRDLPAQIQQIALNHNLMSNYTAFIAVDSSRRTAGKRGTTVHQAVPVPEGVTYETTVPGE